VRKYSPKTTPSLLKWKREFENSKLKAGTDPEEWIGDLEGICFCGYLLVVPNLGTPVYLNCNIVTQ
jgi:hypothetical protein